jgi:hypothetical protein
LRLAGGCIVRRSARVCLTDEALDAGQRSILQAQQFRETVFRVRQGVPDLPLRGDCSIALRQIDGGRGGYVLDWTHGDFVSSC